MRVDSEYYQPKYLTQGDKIATLHPRPLSDLALVTDGNHMTISDKFTDSGVRYLRGQDLSSDFFISDANPIYIPHNEYEKLQRSHMKPGDVLLSVVGTIGSVAIVTEKYPHLTGSCKIAIIRTKGVNPYYLAAYLASGVGQDQIARRIRGAVQQGLILPDLKEFPIPATDDRYVDEIEGLIRKSRKQQQMAEDLYAEAKALLLAELGLDELDLSHQPMYTQSFSQAWTAGRLDAEHYQPKYYRVLDALQSLNPRQMLPLDAMLETITNGHTPLRHDLSVGEVLFITAEFVSDFRVDYDSNKRILSEHHETELQRTALCDGDLLVTIKGRIGNAAVVAHLPGDVNINQDVALLRLKKGYHPYYVAAFLNSEAGKALTDQVCTGQINPFLGLGNLRKVPVPIFEPERMNRIGDRVQELVEAAYQAEQEANRLLEAAKGRVEEMVLGKQVI